MSVGIHKEPDFITTAKLSGDGHFIFSEQIDTPSHDAGRLCLQIADLVNISGAGPATVVSVEINAGFRVQPSTPNSPLFWII